MMDLGKCDYCDTPATTVMKAWTGSGFQAWVGRLFARRFVACGAHIADLVETVRGEYPANPDA